MAHSVEGEVLFRSRIHPKILFKNALLQLLLLGGYYLATAYYPDNAGNEVVDKWGWLLVMAVLAVLECAYVLLPVLRWWNQFFTVTDRKVMNNWGVLYKNSREVDLGRIVSISEERGILDRIFGCGTLNFYDAAAQQQPSSHRNPLTSHSNNGGISFHDIPRVREVKALIEDVRQR